MYTEYHFSEKAKKKKKSSKNGLLCLNLNSKKDESMPQQDVIRSMK